MLIQESEIRTNENKSRLSELQNNVTKKVEELERKYSDFNKVLTSGSDIDKIIARNEVIELLETYQSQYVQQAKIRQSKFVPGEITSIKMSFRLIEVVLDGTSDNDVFHTEPVKDKSANMRSKAVDVKDLSLPMISPAKADKELAPTTFSNKIPMKNASTTPNSTEQKSITCEFEADNFTTDKVTSSYESMIPTLCTNEDAGGYNSNKADFARTSKISSDTATLFVTSPEISLNIISKFKQKSTVIRSICPVSDSTAYLQCDGEYSIDKVDKNGQLQGSIKIYFVVCDFVVTSEGDFICTVDDSENIYKVTMKEKIKEKLYTGPLYPYCLCLSSDGHILVSMCDEWSYDVNKTSKRLVTRMTTTGQILTTYEYDNDKRLFTLPWGIDKNTNKDICVVNRTSGFSGHVVILNASGKLKCTYEGQANERFDPVRVKCDKFGYIFVSDFNKKIHILNRKGQLIKYLKTDNDLQYSPWSLAIDSNNLLWVGCGCGLVYIVKFFEDLKIHTI
ncbi:hypothetical protein KUTeg_023260 [Tegillarca granosa]|uniref:Tripartite motif-containing protein 2 n=1 Tax=Tegillarca granosa TaxID=220873 RepID=A0ABQ9E6W0_TEGGR|nr:hypothetical protein KUTeg_023260 [Tegillarca granosa]